MDIGDHVRKGQLMAMLDDRALRAACDEEKAKVASLRAQVKEWQSEQQVDEADLRRADALRTESILSDENWEHVKYKLAETVSEVARYQADESAAVARLEEANLQLAQSQIVAPFAGVVGRRSLRMAQEVKTGDVLFWITAAAPLHVMFTVPESAMRAFGHGASLVLTTADYPELRQQGRVYRVSPVVDPASGSVQVMGEVINPSPLLKPGMTMQVRTADNANDAVARVAMNLSEALDAALPEIPKTQLSRARPPRLDPELVTREDVLDGEPVVGILQRSKGSFFPFPATPVAIGTVV